MEEILKNADQKMAATIEALKKDFMTVRTGRASTAIVDNIRVDYEGVPTPINHLAVVSVAASNMITIQPWEHKTIALIEKAIMASNIGITPSNDGVTIKLVIPPLSEERRNELVKSIKKMNEDQKVILRNHRRDAMDAIKKLEKNKEISQDDLKRGEAKLQKIVDKYIALADDMTVTKEKELRQV